MNHKLKEIFALREKCNDLYKLDSELNEARVELGKQAYVIEQKLNNRNAPLKEREKISLEMECYILHSKIREIGLEREKLIEQLDSLLSRIRELELKSKGS